MAEEIDAILVKIGIQIKEFQKGFEKVEDLLDDYKKNISDVGKKIDETSSKMQDKLANTAKKTGEVLKDSFNKTEISADKAKKSVDSLGDSTKRAGEKAVKSGVDFKSFEKTLDAVGKKSNDIGKKMGAKITIPTAIVGGLGLKQFVDFEKQILRAGAVTQATSEEFNDMSKTAVELGSKTEFSAGQAAEALGNLGQLGLSASNSIKVLPKTVDLATAGLIPLSDAATITANAINIMGLSIEEVSHLSDVLVVGASKTGASVQEIGTALVRVGPSAKATNQKLEDIVASIGALRDVGVDASTTGTELRNVFIRLSSPTEEAKKRMQEFNLEVKDADGELKKLPDLVDMFSKKLAGLSGAEKLDVLATIFDVRTASVFLALMDSGADKIRDLSESMKGADGSAKRMADAIRGGIGGALNELVSKTESSFIEIFDLIEDDVKKIVRFIIEMIKKFDALPDSVKKSIIIFTSLLAVVSPLLIAFGTMASLTSSAISGFSTMAGVVGKVGTALKALNIASITTYFATLGTQIGAVSASFYGMLAPLAAIALKIAVVITALLLVVNAGMTIIRHWDELVDYAQEIWGSISNFIKEKISGVVKYISNYLSNLYDDWAYIWDSMGSTVSDVWNAMTTPIAKVANWIKDTVKKVIVGALNAMIKTYNNVIDVIGVGTKIDLFDSFSEVEGMAKEAWSNVKTATKRGVAEVVQITTDTAKATAKIWKDWGATFADETSKNYEQVKKLLGLTEEAKIVAPSTSETATVTKTEEQTNVTNTQESQGGIGFVEGLKTKFDQMKQLTTDFWAWYNEAQLRALDMSVQQWLGFSITYEGLLLKMQESTRSMWQAFSDGFATAISNTLVLGKSFSEQMKELWKSLAAMAVKALVQIALQAIVSNLIIAAASKKSGATAVKARAGEAYAGGLASMSAAPFPINLTAPLFASTMSNLALGGLAMVGSAERGGIITRHGMVEVGEKNKREAIIPLEGSEALGGARNQTIIIELNDRVLLDTVIRGMPEHVRLKTGSHI